MVKTDVRDCEELMDYEQNRTLRWIGKVIWTGLVRSSLTDDEHETANSLQTKASSRRQRPQHVRRQYGKPCEKVE